MNKQIVRGSNPSSIPICHVAAPGNGYQRYLYVQTYLRQFKHTIMLNLVSLQQQFSDQSQVFLGLNKLNDAQKHELVANLNVGVFGSVEIL